MATNKKMATNKTKYLLTNKIVANHDTKATVNCQAIGKLLYKN